MKAAINNAKAYLGQKAKDGAEGLANLLEQLEIKSLVDKQKGFADYINSAPERGGLTDADYYVLGILYEANEYLFPTSVLDVIPGGGGKVIKRSGELIKTGVRAEDAVKVATAEARAVKTTSKIETTLPPVNTWEQARNKVLNIVGDLGADAKPVVGRLGSSAGNGKIVGRQSADGKVGWRLDYDPDKGIHINVWDYTNGKGPGKAIKQVQPFNGDEQTFKTLLNQLNN